MGFDSKLIDRNMGDTSKQKWLWKTCVMDWYVPEFQNGYWFWFLNGLMRLWKAQSSKYGHERHVL